MQSTIVFRDPESKPKGVGARWAYLFMDEAEITDLSEYGIEQDIEPPVAT